MKVFEDHKAVPISEMREGALVQLPTKKAPTSPCQKHEGKHCKLYCFDCEQFICRDCTLVDHSGHKFDFVKGIAHAFRDEVLSSIVPLRETHNNITTAIARVECSKREIRDQVTDIAMTITQSFEELRTVLNDHEQLLLHQTSEMVEKKVGTLDRQQEDLQLALATLNSLVEFVERTVENASDKEFISMKQQMTSRMQEIGRKYKCLELAPTEVANIGSVMPQTDSLRELCQKQSAVYISTVDATKCHISGPGLKSAITNEVTKFTVCTKDSHSQPTPVQQNVSAELKSRVDGSVLQAIVVSQTSSMYEVYYTPSSRGCQELTLQVDGTNIGIFQVLVQHPPTQLGIPVKVIDKVTPAYIAVGNKGELLVTEHWDHQYTVLNTQGQRILTIGSKGKPPFEYGYTTGIATDDEGNVYVASDHIVQKLNRCGEVVKSIGKKGRNVGEFDWPWGVRYYRNHVYVCDSYNGRVQVFDSNLNFVRLFGTHGDAPGQLKKPRNIDFDTKGNIYVVDLNKDQVLVFSEDGKYLRNFGQKGQGKGELNEPEGLCISGDYVYVTEWGNSRVSVFHTSGEFVHSFGKYGSERGELRSPYGIAIDQDGFVFVCDIGNKCIQVF